MHPYKEYIETKAADYFSRQAHEPQCKTLQPYRPPTGTNGETYDVYIVQHCDCWLSDSFKEMTVARKFFALRNLAHQFGLHSADCDRYKRTSITYRNRPEVMTGWCNCWLSVDTRPDPPVDYDKDQEQRKEHTMGDLSTATRLAETAEQAQRDIDNFLAPFVDKFRELSIELNTRDTDLWDYTVDRFVEVDGSSFCLIGEDSYQYGEHYTPTLNLPFDFVEDPAAYRQKAIDEKVKREEKAAAKKKKDAEELVERLKAYLAKAEADLANATQVNDPISTIASRNQAQKIRSELASRTDKG